MNALVLGLVLVPAADLALKRLVLRRTAISLGWVGEIRPVWSQIRLRRVAPALGAPVLWLLWTLGAAAAAVVQERWAVPPWALGLILGGALTHALETTIRGSVCDYVCLRVWPAFDLADAALALGGLGALGHLAGVLT